MCERKEICNQKFNKPIESTQLFYCVGAHHYYCKWQKQGNLFSVGFFSSSDEMWEMAVSCIPTKKMSRNFTTLLLPDQTQIQFLDASNTSRSKSHFEHRKLNFRHCFAWQFFGGFMSRYISTELDWDYIQNKYLLAISLPLS